MRVAIFDVDGTLVAGKSTEKRFIGWMLRRGHIGLRQLLSAAWFRRPFRMWHRPAWSSAPAST